MDGIVHVARLLKECGEIEGRKKFQKIVFILQCTGGPFKEQFGYLHFGPYSSQLKRELDLLAESDFVEESKFQAGDYKGFKYRPTKELKDFLRVVGDSNEPSWATLAKSMNKKSSLELEAISTILFLMQRGFANQRLQERFSKLKPSLSNLFEDALKQANKIVASSTS